MQARSVAEGIVASVALMQESRLPCFGRGAPIPNLRKRFHLDMTEAKAAAFMRSTILDAYDKVMPCAHGLASVISCMVNGSQVLDLCIVSSACMLCLCCLLAASHHVWRHLAASVVQA